MPSAETQIDNLLYSYAECVDSGDFYRAAELFEHAQVRVPTADVSHHLSRRVGT